MKADRLVEKEAQGFRKRRSSFRSESRQLKSEATMKAKVRLPQFERG